MTHTSHNRILFMGENETKCPSCNGQGSIYDGSSTMFVMRCNYCRGSGKVACYPNQQEVPIHVSK